MGTHERIGNIGAGLALLVAGVAATAGQLDSATYFALNRGMSESELLLRAGQPDLVTHPGGEVISRRSAIDVVDDREDPRLRLIGAHRRDRFVEVKQYHYIPDHTEHDPHLTVVTLRAGRVFEIERTKLLTRPKPPTPEPAPETGTATRPSLTDTEVRIERLDRVLSAAEAYAATRARLKEQARASERVDTTETGSAEGRNAAELYKGIGDDGVPYFGDRPVRE